MKKHSAETQAICYERFRMSPSAFFGPTASPPCCFSASGAASPWQGSATQAMRDGHIFTSR